MNFPTLDEAVERGKAELLAGQVTFREIIGEEQLAEWAEGNARRVLVAAGWEELRAEVEEWNLAYYKRTAERDSLRDLCDKLAEALGNVGQLLSVTDWDNPDTLPFDAPLYLRWWKREAQPALSLYQKRRGTA